LIASELHILGSDLDRYLAAIAPVWSKSRRTLHLRLYRDLTPLLTTHDLNTVPSLIDGLEEALKPVDWIRKSRRDEAATGG
jgi:hypothetical protein